MTAPTPPRPPAFPPGTRVRWRAGHVTLCGTVVSGAWAPAQHTYRYTLMDVRGAAIDKATMLEPALQRAPPEQ